MSLNWTLRQILKNVKKYLKLIYDKIAEGGKIRNKCQWYEESEKSTNVFLNLERKQSFKVLVRKTTRFFISNFIFSDNVGVA